MTAKLDLSKPIQTRNGFQVTHVILDKKIMGVVQYDEQEAVFCSWAPNGEIITLFPRNKNETHALDLVNVEGGSGG